MNRRTVVVCACLIPPLVSLGIWIGMNTVHPVPPPAVDQWAAEDSCQTCHQPQHQSWLGSHHHLAMQSANEHSVLGDFNDHTFVGQRARTHFLHKADGFWVSTTGADGNRLTTLSPTPLV